jgi:NAD(P)-dependent dehydrogenase (short-subunit alcohol dehydrogenase family)
VGADPGGPQAVADAIAEALAGDDATVHHLGLDLAAADAPARLINAATDAFGHLDILVCNHAWGAPDDPACLIAWLATDEAAWITGQTINTEGGFRR